MAKVKESLLEQVKPDDLKEVINYAFKSKQPVFIEGRTGIGKSYIVKEIAEELGVGLVDMRVILKDIGDLVMRIPDVKERTLVEIITEELPTDGEGIIFLDEFKQAPVEIRRMFYQLILDGRLGATYEKPKGWIVISASNLDEEIDQEDLEAPLFDRFVLRVRLVNNLDEWKKWAYEHNMNAIVISFLQYFTDKFQIEDAEGKALMTPRRWEWVSNALDNEATTIIFRAMMPGGLSDEFLAYKAQVEMFKNLDEYLSGKKEVPDGLDKQYALASALINRVKSDKDLGKVLTSEMKNMNTEVDVFLRLGTISRHRRINNDKNVDALAAINRLPKKVRKLVIKTYSKFNWLTKEGDDD